MKIGVFVCHCGLNIAGVINIQKVISSVKNFENVFHVEDNIYSCSASGLQQIKDSIKKYNLDRVVVAACTPRTHEYLYREICREAGLNPYVFEFVNIREQCSWVHMNEPGKATEKAIDLIRMGVAKAALLRPLEVKEVEVEPSVIIIGAGISGIVAALNLSRSGFKVYLVEREPKIGGVLNDLNLLFPTNVISSDLLNRYINEVYKEERITVLTSSALKDVKGFVGNFDVTVVREGKEVKLKVGAIIVATGATEFEPKGLFGYGKYNQVMTQLQFEKATKNMEIEKVGNVVMIQCVGLKEIGYCGRICCVTALKNAILIKQKYPNSRVYILFIDMQAHGHIYENYYKKAKEEGIRFIRFNPEKPPEIFAKNDKLMTKVYDVALGEEIEIPSDLVILSTPLVQREESSDLSKLLKVPLGKDGFFLEAHKKLRPAEFMTDGIFICGAAHAPKDVQESVESALAAAGKAAILLAKGKVCREPITVELNEQLCSGCRICEGLCPFGAITFDDVKKNINVNGILCRGCGICVSACPTKALNQNSFENDQIVAMIRSLSTSSITRNTIIYM